MAEISIIMPVYNGEYTIGKAIDSILHQSFTDWELIIINDGSSDNTQDMCNRYNDARIHCFYKENGGVSCARNFGLSKATGEFIAFIDSDDYVECDYLEKLYHPEYDFILSGITKINSEGVKTNILPEYSGKCDKSVFLKSFYNIQRQNGIYGFVAGKLVRRSLLIDNKIFFDEKITLAEDLDFYTSIYEIVESVFFILYSGYEYNVNNSGLTNVELGSRVDYFQQIDIQKKIKNMIENNNSFSRDDLELYNNLISTYIYTIVIENKFCKWNDFKTIMGRIQNIDFFVSPSSSFIMRSILVAVKKRKYCFVYCYVKLRSLLGR